MKVVLTLDIPPEHAAHLVGHRLLDPDTLVQSMFDKHISLEDMNAVIDGCAHLMRAVSREVMLEQFVAVLESGLRSITLHTSKTSAAASSDSTRKTRPQTVPAAPNKYYERMPTIATGETVPYFLDTSWFERTDREIYYAWHQMPEMQQRPQWLAFTKEAQDLVTAALARHKKSMEGAGESPPASEPPLAGALTDKTPAALAPKKSKPKKART